MIGWLIGWLIGWFSYEAFGGGKPGDGVDEVFAFAEGGVDIEDDGLAVGLADEEGFELKLLMSELGEDEAEGLGIGLVVGFAGEEFALTSLELVDAGSGGFGALLESADVFLSGDQGGVAGGVVTGVEGVGAVVEVVGEGGRLAVGGWLLAVGGWLLV